ncbi:MAG: hypothetical protein J6T40_03315 [Clostridiales bacterium]|nr:hypothetical protein [Clostridiales bacterium]
MNKLERKLLNIFETISVCAFTISALMMNYKKNVPAGVPLFFAFITLIVSLYEMFSKKPIKS